MAIFDFNNLSSLSDVELSVYRFVVNNPEKVAYMRVRDIAKKTHVANSSVMRFVHKIGFASFPEFKAYLKNINQTVAPQKALTFIDQQNFPNDIENKLRVVADQLYQSDNIPIMGTGNSASSSKLLINGLLRNVLKFNGLAITDATPMIGYNAAMARKDLLPATINAGIDMILFNKNIDEDYRFIHEAIDNGTLSMERVDEAVTRILGTKLAQGIMNTKSELTLLPPKEINLHSDEHKKLAEAVAKKSVTLVKDRDQLLPLTPKKYPRVRLVVLGDSDDGGFKEGGHVTQAFKNVLEKEGFKVTLFDRKNLDFHEMFEEGVEDMEKKFDLAFYVANVETASNQTTTRLDWIHLMAADSPWYMKSIPTVFVSTANPYHLYDIPNVSTFINAYTGNQASIDAIMRKVTGKEKFEGKSPVDPFCGDFTTRL